MPLFRPRRGIVGRTVLAGALATNFLPTQDADAQQGVVLRPPLASAVELARASETIVPFEHCRIFSAATRETLSVFNQWGGLSLTARTSLGKLLLNSHGELYCGGTNPIPADRVIAYETDRDLNAIQSIIRRADELARDRGLITTQDVIDAREGRRDFFFMERYAFRPADRPTRPPAPVGSIEQPPRPAGPAG